MPTACHQAQADFTLQRTNRTCRLTRRQYALAGYTAACSPNGLSSDSIIPPSLTVQLCCPTGLSCYTGTEYAAECFSVVPPITIEAVDLSGWDSLAGTCTPRGTFAYTNISMVLNMGVTVAWEATDTAVLSLLNSPCTKPTSIQPRPLRLQLASILLVLLAVKPPAQIPQAQAMSWYCGCGTYCIWYYSVHSTSQESQPKEVPHRPMRRESVGSSSQRTRERVSPKNRQLRWM